MVSTPESGGKKKIPFEKKSKGIFYIRKTTGRVCGVLLFLTGKMKTTIKKLKPYENNLKKNPETLRSGVKL